MSDAARTDSLQAAEVANDELRDGELLASVDLGSNSFHLAVARYEQGRLHVVDRLREAVQLAMGQRADGSLDAIYRSRAITCLARFGQRLRALPIGRVRAVATNAVRQLSRPQAFLVPAETALGHPIEVVSGREEARLIYLGAAHHLPRSDSRRLIVDIGGGSTEFIIGQGFEAQATESVQVGCIASTLRFFADARCTSERWQQARMEIAVELQQFAADYRKLGWSEAFGSSGTVKSIAAVAEANGWCEQGISRTALNECRQAILHAGGVTQLELPGLEEERRSTFAGGAVILDAVFDTFDLTQIGVCATAMREGLLYDLVGRTMHGDPRATSIAALARRYGADSAQAARVRTVALALFDQIAESRKLGAAAREMLAWAAEIHEIGLAVAHSKYHVHGAYIIAHADLDGFSHQGKQALAAIIRSHRRKPHLESIIALPGRLQQPVRWLIALLRLAALLERSRTSDPLPALRLRADEQRLALELPAGWLDRHPLTQADLRKEQSRLELLGLHLELQTTAAVTTTHESSRANA